jgi:hypothetical protein
MDSDRGSENVMRRRIADGKIRPISEDMTHRRSNDSLPLIVNGCVRRPYRIVKIVFIFILGFCGNYVPRFRPPNKTYLMMQMPREVIVLPAFRIE